MVKLLEVQDQGDLFADDAAPNLPPTPSPRLKPIVDPPSDLFQDEEPPPITTVSPARPEPQQPPLVTPTPYKRDLAITPPSVAPPAPAPVAKAEPVSPAAREGDQPIDLGEFGNAVLQSAGPQNWKYAGHTLATFADLKDEDSPDADKMIREGTEAAKRYKPARVQSYKDVHNWGDLGAYVAQAAGQGVGSTILPVAGGILGGYAGDTLLGKPGAIVGGIGGALSSSAVLNIGSMRESLIEEGVKDRKVRGSVALVGGAAMSALDSLLPGEVAGKMTGTVRREVEKYMAVRILKAMGKDAFKEGWTEGAQQVIQDIGSKMAAGKDPRAEGQKIIDDIVDNVIAGAIGGAAFGAVGEAGPSSETKQEQPQTDQVSEFLKKVRETPPPVPPPAGPGPSGPAAGPPGGGGGAVGGEPQPNRNAKGNRQFTTAEDAARLLKGAGYTREDIASMSPEQYAQTLADLRQQGQKPAPGPVETGPVKPPPGTAPPAPKGKVPTGTQQAPSGTNLPPVELPTVPGWPTQEAPQSSGEQTAPAETVSEQVPHGERTDRVAEAERIIRESGKASTSLIQRKLNLPFKEAASVMEELENRGVVSKATATGDRQILPPQGATPQVIDLPSGGKLVEATHADAFGDGSKAKPVTLEDAADVEGVRNQVNPEPSQAQIDAGNYKKAHVKLRTLPGRDISIETAAGGNRTGVNPDTQQPWSVTMQHDYGHILGTKGVDGDPIDVFIGPNPGSDRAFVIYQQDPHSKKFDEHKVIVGANSQNEAEDIYERGFSDNKGAHRIQSIEEMSMPELNDWLDNPTRPGTAPVAPKVEEKPPSKAEQVKQEQQAYKEEEPTETKPKFADLTEEGRKQVFIDNGVHPRRAGHRAKVSFNNLDIEERRMFAEGAQTLTRKEYEAQGAQAFAEGKPARTPKEIITDHGNAASEAWLRGWHNANLGQKVPGVSTASHPEEGKPDHLKDFGKEPVTGYGDAEGNANPRKKEFLDDARRYLRKVEQELMKRGFTARTDKKGKKIPSVHVNEAGPAVSGDVYLDMMHPERADGIQVQIGHSILRPGTSLVARTKNDEGKTGNNNWWGPNLSVGELADRLDKLAGKPLESLKPEPVAEKPEAPELTPDEIDALIGQMARETNQKKRDALQNQIESYGEKATAEFVDEYRAALKAGKDTDVIWQKIAAKYGEHMADRVYRAAQEEPEEEAAPPKKAAPPKTRAEQEERYESNLIAAKNAKPLPYPDDAETMRNMGLIGKIGKDGVFKIAKAGERWLEQRKKEQAEKRVLDERLAKLPSDPAEIEKAYRKALEDYHWAFINDDEALRKAAGQRMEDLELKESGAEQLQEKVRAPNGEIPMWGQRGRFIVEHKGVKAIIDFGDFGDSIYAVSLTDKFPSSTGYHSVGGLGFIGEKGGQLQLGMSVEDYGKALIQKSIDYKSPDNKRHPPAYPERAYKLPKGKGEPEAVERGVIVKKGEDFPKFREAEAMVAEARSIADWKKRERAWPQGEHRNEYIVAIEGDKLVPKPDFPTSGPYYIFTTYQDARRYVADGAHPEGEAEPEIIDHTEEADTESGVEAERPTISERQEQTNALNREANGGIDVTPENWEKVIAERGQISVDDGVTSGLNDWSMIGGEPTQAELDAVGDMVQPGDILHIKRSADISDDIKAVVDAIGKDGRLVIRHFDRDTGKVERKGQEHYPDFFVRNGKLYQDYPHWIMTARVEKGEAPKPAPAPKAEAPSTYDPLVDAFRDRLLDPDGGFKTITEARAFAADKGFVKEDAADNKTLEEKIEFAVVLAARETVAATKRAGRTVSLAYDRLVDLYKRQPKLGTRTSKSMAEQAYSTPAPIAFLASRLAHADTAESILEPTAGNGMLLMEAPIRDHAITVNELDDTRAANLRAQGFYVSQKDAAKQSLRHKGYPVQSIIMNPPFGAVLNEKGKSERYKVDNYETTRIDYAIALRQLQSLAPDGRAVLILGGPSKPATASVEGQREFYRAAAQREFYYRLYGDYNVVDHFTVQGDLYARQGAGWPIDMIVIDGKGKSARPLPGVTPPPIFDSFEALKEKLDGRGFEPRGADRGRSEPSGTPDRGEPGPETGDEGGGGSVEGGGSPGLQPTEGQPVRVRTERGDGQSDVLGSGGPALGGGNAEPSARPVDRTVGEPSGAEPSPTRLEPQNRVSTEPDSGESALQRRYKPAAKSAKSLGMLVPANMQTATQDALANIGEEVDPFVARNLGYREDDLKNHFSAEQLDAIALAIKEYQRGGALIIGDQTGAGKGRIVAALIRYALKQGQVPVFLTEKPDLYGDMFRDMNDIGLPKFLGRDVNIFATNSGAVVPLDDEAVEWKGEYDEAKKRGETPPPKRGTFLRTGTAESVKKAMANATAEGVPGHDVVFTTYDQTNTVKGADTERRAFLRKMMPNAFLILDEAHNAGGGDAGWDQDEKGPKNRADFIREMVDNAKGVMYSSATYAKRPDVMDLYRRTDMAKAVENIADLGELIAKGGVPLQQVTAAMLAQQGQYIRRERSFEGIAYDLTELDVDRETYDSFSTALRAVQQFDLTVQPIIKERMNDILAESGLAVSKDPSVGIAGASQTGFSSVMHNLINQMLLAAKVDGTIRQALDVLKANEKPVIALASTMESFMDQYAEDNNLKTGDPINLTFKDALRRYLDRSLRITVKNHDKTKSHIQVPLSTLQSGIANALYNEAKRAIDESTVDQLPISPIDALRNGLEKAGYKVREITGRKRVIDYSGSRPILKVRDPGEIGSAGKRVSVKAFNDGKADVLIFNRSGSTGISMHAGPKFKDQRRRVMLLQQAEGNIDTHMQTLGRINRTGQVVLPGYKQLAAKIPAEARPAAVLLRKMASLNASTTASRKGALNDESIVDFINKYGDQVVWDTMREYPELNRVMNWPIDPTEREDIPNAAAKVTGKMTLLKLDEQEMLLEAITRAYKSLIAQLDATGENELEAKSLDLQARVLDTKTMKPKEGDSVFQDGIYAEWSSVKSDGKSMNGTDLVKELADEAGEADVTTENRVQRMRDLAKKLDAKREKRMDLQQVGTNYVNAAVSTMKDQEKAQEARERGMDNVRRFVGLYEVLAPGSLVTIKGKDGGADMDVIPIWTRRTGRGKNPLGLSSWEVKLALPSSYRTLTVPFSQLYLPAFPIPEGGKGVNIEVPRNYHTPERMAQALESFDDASKSGREDRWIFTGNLLGGYEMVGGGQVVNFTSEDGRLRQGVLMPKGWDMADFNKNRPVEFATPAQVAEFLNRAEDKGVTSRDGIVDLIQTPYGKGIQIEGSRAVGGKYFLNQGVRRATEDRITKAGGKMRWQTNDQATFEKVIKALMDAGARFQTRTEQDLAVSIINPGKGPEPTPPAGGGFRAASPAPQAAPFYSAVLRTIQEKGQPKASARQWMAMIRNAPGVKRDELDWLGLDDWLAQKGDEPVTRGEIADFVSANQIQIDEIDKSGAATDLEVRSDDWNAPEPDYEAEAESYMDEARQALIDEGDENPSEYWVKRFARDMVDQRYESTELVRNLTAHLDDGRVYKFHAVFDKEDRTTTVYNETNQKDAFKLGPQRTPPDQAQLERNIRDHLENEGVNFDADTEFSGYTLPGADNDYHELLLTLPRGQREDLGVYKGPHWSEPNVLAHVRFDTRTDADGKRVLFIEEIQSDWHQRGRESGYGKKMVYEAYADGDLRGQFNTREEAEERIAPERRAGLHVNVREREVDTGIPDAPFKTSWPELAMKRMIRWAAENGFDRIAWTTGEQQAERYDLRKTIDSITITRLAGDQWRKWWPTPFKGGPMDPITTDNDGKIVDAGRVYGDIKGKNISDVFGKSIAEKGLSATASETKLSGVDLKIGGEGMKGFYDKMLVDVANKLGKKFGAKVGQTTIDTSAGGISGEMVMDDLGIRTNRGNFWRDLGQRGRDEAIDALREKQKVTPVHSIDVTPEMQHSVMQGQPVFDAATQQKIEGLTQAEKDKIVAEVSDLSEKILGHRIKTSLIGNLPNGNQGEYDPASRMIWIAVNVARQSSAKVFSHEAIHAMRDTGIITAPEWGVLKRWAENYIMPTSWWQQRAGDWNVTYDKWGFGPGGREDLMIEEAVAEGFASFISGKPGEPLYNEPTGLVAKIYQKLRLFFERLRSLLEGAGFNTAEEIFQNIERGGMRNRPMAGRNEGRAARNWRLEPRLTDIPTVQPQPADRFTAAQPPLRNRMPPSRSNQRSFMEPNDDPIAVLTDRTLPLLTRVSGALGNTFAPVRKGLQDRMLHWKRVQARIEEQLGPIDPATDVYRAETLMSGRVGERLEDLQIDEIAPLIEQMSEKGVTTEELNEYLYANHAEERNNVLGQLHPQNSQFFQAMTNHALVGASGMSTEEAHRILITARPETAQIAKRVYQMLAETRLTLLREGIIDQATYDNWTKTYKYYVPLRGFEADPEEGARAAVGNRYDSRAKPSQEALGRRSRADSPLAYTIAGAQQAIILAEKARVGRAVLAMARRYPNERLWTVNQVVMRRYISKATGLVTHTPDNNKRRLADNVLAVRVGGNLYWVTIHHLGLAAGVRGMDAPSVNQLFRYMMGFNRYLAQVRTGWNPQFFIPNFLRDAQTAGIHLTGEQGTALALKVARDIPAAMRGAWQGSRGNLNSQWAQYYRDFAQAGGKVGAWVPPDIETIKARVNREFRRLQPGVANRMILGAIWARDFMEDVNGAIENAVRLSTYVNMRRGGYSQDEAASVAKELTVNFNRKGEWGPIINSMYLFANASLQGTSRVAFALAKSKVVRRVALGLFVSGILLDFMNAALSGAGGGGGDDDKNAYDEIPEYIRERNFIFMYPGAEQPIKVPMPWVYNVFEYAGVNFGRYMRGKIKGMEAATNIGGALLQAANPVQSATWLQMVTPTLLDPWVDLETNTDWKGDPIMPEQRDYGVPLPDSQRFFSTVSPQYKEAAELMNAITGGDKVRPGAVDVSPESLEYLSDFLFGGVKQTVDQTATTIEKVISGDPVEWTKVPLVRVVYGGNTPQTGRNEYYDMRDAVALTKADFDQAVKDRDTAKIKEIQAQYPADLKAAPLFKEFDKRLKELNKAFKAASDSETKRNIRKAMDQVQAKARKTYDDLQKELGQ